MSEPVLLVTIGGKKSSKEAVEEARTKIINAAKEACNRAAILQYDRTKQDIELGYKIAAFEPVSLGYAYTIAKREEPGRKWAKGELKDRASAIVANEHVGLKITGELLRGIKREHAKEEGNLVYATVTSEAEYSKDLEEGYLFGKRRPGKKRRFFTRHYGTTLHVLVREFKKELEDIEND